MKSLQYNVVSLYKEWYWETTGGDLHLTVTTPRDMQTTLVIAKMDNELACVTPNMAVDVMSTNFYIIFPIIVAPGVYYTLLVAPILMVSGYS